MVNHEQFTNHRRQCGLAHQLARLPATLPDKPLVAEVAKFATPLRAAIANNEQQNQELTQLRDWLLPMLMNGQVTVGMSEG